MITDNTVPIKISFTLLNTVLVLEALYFIARYFLLSAEFFDDLTFINQELSWTSVRALSLALVLHFCWRHKTIPDFLSRPNFSWKTVLLLTVFFVTTFLIRQSSTSVISEQVTLAATTVIVAFREELVYRYVLQNWLESWVSPQNHRMVPIFFSSITFTLYHIGAQPLWTFPWICIAGLLLGAIYKASGKSILLVIVCHFICDLFFI